MKRLMDSDEEIGLSGYTIRRVRECLEEAAGYTFDFGL